MPPWTRRQFLHAGVGLAAQVEGEVIANEVTFRPRRQLVVKIADETGELTLRFLNFYGSQTKQMAEGVRLRVRGDVRGGFFGAEMVHPTVRPAPAALPWLKSLPRATRAATARPRRLPRRPRSTRGR